MSVSDPAFDQGFVCTPCMRKASTHDASLVSAARAPSSILRNADHMGTTWEPHGALGTSDCAQRKWLRNADAAQGMSQVIDMSVTMVPDSESTARSTGLVPSPSTSRRRIGSRQLCKETQSLVPYFLHLALRSALRSAHSARTVLDEQLNLEISDAPDQLDKRLQDRKELLKRQNEAGQLNLYLAPPPCLSVLSLPALARALFLALPLYLPRSLACARALTLSHPFPPPHSSKLQCLASSLMCSKSTSIRLICSKVTEHLDTSESDVSRCSVTYCISDVPLSAQIYTPCSDPIRTSEATGGWEFHVHELAFPRTGRQSGVPMCHGVSRLPNETNTVSTLDPEFNRYEYQIAIREAEDDHDHLVHIVRPYIGTDRHMHSTYTRRHVSTATCADDLILCMHLFVSVCVCALALASMCLWVHGYGRTRARVLVC